MPCHDSSTIGWFRGQASDIEIHAREIFIKERLNRLMAEHSGQDYETVARDTDRDNSYDSPSC